MSEAHDSLGRCLRCGATVTTGGCSRCDSVTVMQIVGVVHPDGRTTEVDPVDSCLSCAALRSRLATAEAERDAAEATARLYAERTVAAEDRAAAFREAARAARPVVDQLRTPAIGWVALALAALGYGRPHHLAAYDRYCDHAPPPDDEPEAVAILVHALAVLAVREMGRL